MTCLALHGVACVLVWLGLRFHYLQVKQYLYPVVVLLPLWGVLILLALHAAACRGADKIREVGLERMELESELYKEILVEERNSAASTIPMEEALILNSSRECRSMIMDILNDNPKEYIQFLQKAGVSEDSEVVHYAVTALIEISKENDDRLQQLEAVYQKEPENLEVLSAYADFLWQCLEQDLMKGHIEAINRRMYSELAMKKLRLGGTVEDAVRLIRNCLRLKDYPTAERALTEVQVRWPDNEKLILLRIEYLTSLGRGKELHQYLRHLRQDNVYFSAQTREVLAFWDE